MKQLISDIQSSLVISVAWCLDYYLSVAFLFFIQVHNPDGSSAKFSFVNVGLPVMKDRMKVTLFSLLFCGHNFGSVDIKKGLEKAGF